MKKLFLFVILLFVFCTVNVYAKSRNIIFFVDDLNSMSQKTINKILSSNEFKFVARINPQNSLSPEVENLVNSGKLLPVLEITNEPYFPLLSEKILADSSLSFDRTYDLSNLLEKYKETYSDLFSGDSYGLFLKDSILNNETLKILYKHDFSWTTVKPENAKVSGVFYNEGIILFVPSKSFPLAEKQISTWLAQSKNTVIPVLLSQKHLQNDKLMAYIIDLFETSKYTNVILPSDLLDETIKFNEVALYKDKYLPRDMLVKIAKASEEVDNQESSQMYETIFAEFANMYSSDLVTRIIKNDETAKKLFDISFKNIFKIAGQEIPDINVKESSSENRQNQNQQSCFVKTDKGYKLNSSGIIKSFEIRENDGYVDFYVNSNSELENFDIYIDMNGIIDTGDHKMLKPLEGFFVSENAWEYAIRVKEKVVYVYKFIIDSPAPVRKLMRTENKIRIPKSVLRGNPYNWSYQVVVVNDNKVTGFLANDKEREKFLNTTPLQLKLFKCNE